jgi:hypothetical protein
MIHLVKAGLVLFILSWSGFGIWLVARYDVLFGPHRDDPAETPGARSYGVIHVFWFFVRFCGEASKPLAWRTHGLDAHAWT